ncbi:MAG: chemotaxis protein CheW [Spirochaetaceae bacterium]|jgi:purine-binding chemotaxis protein CheW|nr:chemotaxis protein CheW [Spirochaetaceae bacterium]
MAAAIKDLTAMAVTVNEEIQQQKDRADTVDFKMVTFSLAGKDYGVDIMNVKEIAKADKFTYVPNAESYVRGVYNLRGDIIPIIDLRSFFHMPIEKKKDNLENMLILRIEEKVYGTIVDKIDKVVGINSEMIQPAHPIFGDINIKYISGIVEKNGDLYVILDVLRIFSSQKAENAKKQQLSSIPDVAEGRTFVQAQPEISQAQEPVPVPIVAAPVPTMPVIDETMLALVKDNVRTLQSFHASRYNDEWFRKRFIKWTEIREEAQLQPRNAAEAAEFLKPFDSPFTGKFWDNEYAGAVKSILPDISSNTIQVWNLGCGKGYETYSFACILKLRYPNAQIKIWANDNDIMAISTAPTATFNLDEIPEFCKNFVAKANNNGYVFDRTIKDAIVFEYHDILHDNHLPDIDIILARDLLSIIPSGEQDRLIDDWTEKLKKKGLVIVGRNECLLGEQWQSIGTDPVSVFVYNKQ